MQPLARVGKSPMYIRCWPRGCEYIPPVSFWLVWPNQWLQTWSRPQRGIWCPCRCSLCVPHISDKKVVHCCYSRAEIKAVVVIAIVVILYCVVDRDHTRVSQCDECRVLFASRNVYIIIWRYRSGKQGIACRVQSGCARLVDMHSTSIFIVCKPKSTSV